MKPTFLVVEIATKSVVAVASDDVAKALRDVVEADDILIDLAAMTYTRGAGGPRPIVTIESGG